MSILRSIIDSNQYLSEYPGGAGRGIVMVAGGNYLPSAYIALRHLRSCGCSLPAEMWHLGPREVPAFWNELVRPLGVTMVDATRTPGASHFDDLGGCQCKIHAILGCRFEHVLLLDADNVVLLDPSTVFETFAFTAYGQVFWPDFFYPSHHRYAIRDRAWKDLGLPPRAGLELETGQIAIDRRSCWHQLQLVKALNVRSKQVYGRYTWGDKDTFTLAWLASKRPYYTVPIRPRFVQREQGSVFWQFWPDGRRAFQHQRKWIEAPEEMKGRGLVGELHFEQSLQFLGQFWAAARAAGQERFVTSIGAPAEESPALNGIAELRKLATASIRDGAYADAAQLLMRAVGISPSDPLLRLDLAASLSKAGRPAEAMPHLIRALKLKANAPEVHNNLGVILNQLHRPAEAVAAFRTAIRLKPTYVDAHANLGRALRNAGDPEGAIGAFQAAQLLQPGSAAAPEGIVRGAEEIGDADLACRSLRHLCQLKPSPGTRSWLLYTLHYHPDSNAESLFLEHRQWDRLFGCHTGNKGEFPRYVPGFRRLRIGYVSPDFRDHTVPRFIGALLNNHNRREFDVFCYSDVAEPDATTDRIRAQVEHWRDIVGFSDDQAARVIREDRIDVLVDLRGHAAANRLSLFAKRSAAVQLSMVGYFNTTGLSSMDFRVTDAQQDPPGLTERFHTECLIRLPESCWCYLPDEDSPAIIPPPIERKGYITFGCLNKLIKASEPCIRLWAQVLERTPRARLLLPVASDKVASLVRKRFSALGIVPQRLDLLPKTVTRREYLNRYGEIDIALDSFPFNGITTTCDGLWMGVPLVTLSGGTTVSRAGKSILHAAVLPDFAAQTPEQFLRKTTEIAGDARLLCELRLTMRERLTSSPLMGHAAFARALEQEFCRISQQTTSP